MSSRWPQLGPGLIMGTSHRSAKMVNVRPANIWKSHGVMIFFQNTYISITRSYVTGLRRFGGTLISDIWFFRGCDIWYLIFFGVWHLIFFKPDIWFLWTRDIWYLIFWGVWYLIFDFLGDLISDRIPAPPPPPQSGGSCPLPIPIAERLDIFICWRGGGGEGKILLEMMYWAVCE